MKTRAESNETVLSMVAEGGRRPLPLTILMIFFLALALDFILGFEVYPVDSYPCKSFLNP